MTPEMRTRSPAFSDSTSASENGVRTSLISSEGGCAPLPKPPPFDGAGEAGARSRSLIASLPCGGGRGYRAAPPSSQRHFLVAVGVAFDGDGDGEGGDVTGIGEDVDPEGRGVAA